MRRARLDVELVRRGLAGSRESAAELIAAGRVRVAGQVATKAATAVAPDAPVLLAGPGADEPDPPYASRGGHKLAGALAAFAAAGRPVAVSERRCLDAGASTGGFTDVLLRAGAREVVAVDVGYGQLAWRLRTDPRVTVLDRTNVRGLTAEQLGGPVELAVADLSFISLRLVLPALAGCVRPDGELVVLVKPQFEVGRDLLGSGGVVRDLSLRASAVAGVARVAEGLGLGVRGVVASPLPGPAGNVEFLLRLAQGAAPLDQGELAAVVAAEPRVGGAAEPRVGGAAEPRVGGAAEPRVGGAAEPRVAGTGWSS